MGGHSLVGGAGDEWANHHIQMARTKIDALPAKLSPLFGEADRGMVRAQVRLIRSHIKVANETEGSCAAPNICLVDTGTSMRDARLIFLTGMVAHMKRGPKTLLNIPEDVRGKMAVLDMLHPPLPTRNVAGVGRRVSESEYWIEIDQGEEDV